MEKYFSHGKRQLKENQKEMETEGMVKRDQLESGNETFCDHGTGLTLIVLVTKAKSLARIPEDFWAKIEKVTSCHYAP